MQLALTLVNGDVLLGTEEDIQRLLKFTSGFGAGQGGVQITRRVRYDAGAELRVDETQETARWVNPAHVVRISEVPDA